MFFIAKNSLFGLNNQQKILFQDLRDVSQKVREEFIKNVFPVRLENILNTLFPELVLR